MPAGSPPLEDPTAGIDEPTPAPADVLPVDVLPVESFRADSILAISADGSYGYAGTNSPWNEPTSCTAPAGETLAVLDIAAAEQGDIAPFAAGLEQAGDIRQFIVGPGNSVAILSSCGAFEDPTLWLQGATLGTDGRIETLGSLIPLDGDGQNDPYLLRLVDESTAEVQIVIEVDPNDFDSWSVERRHIDMDTGEVVQVEESNYYDDDAGTRATLTTADGFTYRVVDDPQGALGCEGFGVARTLELDDGTSRRLALTQPGPVFSDVSDLHASASGHIAWTTGCEGFVTAYVGKILGDGTIADAHFLDTYNLLPDTYADFRVYRLTDDGFLVAIGQSVLPGSDEATLQVLRYDLGTDPSFVNTADPAPIIDPDPLFDAAGGDGTWHVGETLASNPACGARTLYAKTAGGFLRAFPAGFEIDTIVDVDLGPTQIVHFGDGEQFISRTVVIQTECPEQYEGRQVWFGTENDQIIWGMNLWWTDLTDVADVLSVRDVLQADSEFVDASFAQVELLDGTVTEVELVAVLFDN